MATSDGLPPPAVAEGGGGGTPVAQGKGSGEGKGTPQVGTTVPVSNSPVGSVIGEAELETAPQRRDSSLVNSPENSYSISRNLLSSTTDPRGPDRRAVAS